MRIVVDGMGSDNAPLPEVTGAVTAAEASEHHIILTGDESVLRAELAKHSPRPNISVVHAPEVITMADSPLIAVRKKRESSIHVGLRLVKSGEADAFVSAGNTGAVMMTARTILNPLPGVKRSPICQMLPTLQDPVVFLDFGANVDSSAHHLCQFAEMGVVYSRHMLGVQNPRVGLLNIGEEQMKGTGLMKTVHQLLSATPHINFIGNVEPKAVYQGNADVVVCDGFIGNLFIKASEAASSFVTSLIRRELGSSLTSRMGTLFSSGAYRRIRDTIDPNQHPGAPLLGVRGAVIIQHGSCTAQGIANAIRGAIQAVEVKLNDHISKGIESLRRVEEKMAEESENV